MQDIFEIHYSSNIKVFKNNSLIKTFPYGQYNTKAFVSYRAKLKDLPDFKEKYLFRRPRKVLEGKNKVPPKGFPPREYQDKAIDVLFQKMRLTGILKAPTGGGKGSIIGYMIGRRNISTLVIVPTADLVYQTAERVRSLLDIHYSLVGEIGEKKKNLDAPIIVSTWQSLATPSTFNMIARAGFGMLICDEVHKASADVLGGIIGRLAIPFKYGMSATPYRTKDEQMQKVHDLLGNIVHEIPVEYLYEKGFLLRPVIVLAETGISLSIHNGIKSYFLDKLHGNEKMRYVFAKKLFTDKQYSMLAPKNRTIENVVHSPEGHEWKLLSNIAKDAYIKKTEEEDDGTDENSAFMKQLGLCKSGIEIHPERMAKTIKLGKMFFTKDNEKGIILFHTKAAGVKFANLMKEQGYDNIYVINGDHPEKSGMIRKLVTGEIGNYIVASTVSLLSEGNDIPSLEKIIVGAPVFPPFTDVGRLQQIIGREVRPDPNNKVKKPVTIIMDDEVDGWINDKKNIVMDHITREFVPDFISYEEYFKEELQSALINEEAMEHSPQSLLSN